MFPNMNSLASNHLKQMIHNEKKQVVFPTPKRRTTKEIKQQQQQQCKQKRISSVSETAKENEIVDMKSLQHTKPIKLCRRLPTKWLMISTWKFATSSSSSSSSSSSLSKPTMLTSSSSSSSSNSTTSNCSPLHLENSSTTLGTFSTEVTDENVNDQPPSYVDTTSCYEVVDDTEECCTIRTTQNVLSALSESSSFRHVGVANTTTLLVVRTSTDLEGGEGVEMSLNHESCDETNSSISFLLGMNNSRSVSDYILAGQELATGTSLSSATTYESQPDYAASLLCYDRAIELVIQRLSLVLPLSLSSSSSSISYYQKTRIISEEYALLYNLCYTCANLCRIQMDYSHVVQYIRREIEYLLLRQKYTISYRNNIIKNRDPNRNQQKTEDDNEKKVRHQVQKKEIVTIRLLLSMSYHRLAKLYQHKLMDLDLALDYYMKAYKNEKETYGMIRVHLLSQHPQYGPDSDLLEEARNVKEQIQVTAACIGRILFMTGKVNEAIRFTMPFP